MKSNLTMKSLRSALLIGTAMGLAACGADDVASPGEGTLVVVTPAPTTPAPTTPTPTTPTPTTPTPTTGPAASCPTGTANVGTINNLRNCQLSGIITGNRVLENLDGTIYSLSGVVNVGIDVGGDGNKAGGQQGILTIEPGVVIFGSSGADALVVNRGSQIFAEGTSTRPIIFTSRTNVEGTAGANSIGQWGGLVLLGRAPISSCSTAVAGGSVDCEGAVEGLSNAFFGGATAGDSSGRLSFVQVRYPGFEVSTGNELNGITMAGVGSGTFFQNIQVHNSSDDGIEWFGGTVNGRNIVVTGADDDSLDMDVGFKGGIQFALVIQRSAGGDYMIEGDSNGDEDETPRTDLTIANFTFVSPRTGRDAILLRGSMDATLVNGIVSHVGECIDIDGATTLDAADASIDENGPPVFNSMFFSCTEDFAVDDGSFDTAAITALLTAGTNNTATGTSTLIDTFIPGANESGVTAFDASTLGSFFTATTYIGAVRDASDTWYAGWTCGVGAGATACETAPTPIAAN